MRAACAAEGKKPTGNSNSKACLPPRALTFYLFTLKIVALILLNVFYSEFSVYICANLTSYFLFLTFFGKSGEKFFIYIIYNGDYIRQYPKFCHGKPFLPLRWLRGGVLGYATLFGGVAYVVIRVTMEATK